jgi:hypothetical protein
MKTTPEPTSALSPSRRHPAGSAILMVVALSGVMMVILSGIMIKSLNQEKALKSRQTGQDFRQIMSALFLKYTYSKPCHDAFGDVQFSNNDNIAIVTDGNRVNKNISVPPNYILAKESGKILGTTVNSVKLERLEILSQYDGQQVWVGRLIVSTENQDAVGLIKRDYTMPMMLMMNGDKLSSCNTNKGLLVYDAYYNSAGGGTGNDVTLMGRSDETKTATPGAPPESVPCLPDEILYGVVTTTIQTTIGPDGNPYETSEYHEGFEYPPGEQSSATAAVTGQAGSTEPVFTVDNTFHKASCTVRVPPAGGKSAKCKIMCVSVRKNG